MGIAGCGCVGLIEKLEYEKILRGSVLFFYIVVSRSRLIRLRKAFN